MIIAACLKLINIQTVIIMGIILYMIGIKEGMGENTGLYSWFEPDGYSGSNSMVNPTTKPLMYRYVYDE